MGAPIVSIEGGESRTQILPLVGLRPGAAATQLGVADIRRLSKIFAVFRWGAGLGVVGLAAVLVPPRLPVLAALLILWVSAYNGLATLAFIRAGDATVRAIARTVAVLDVVSYFALLVIFTGPAPGALYATYVCLLIPMVAFEGAPGAAASVLLFAAGQGALQAARAFFFHQPFSAPDWILWSAIVLVIAVSLTVVSAVMLTAPANASAGGSRGLLAVHPGALRLSPREREVLGLVAQGCSNHMIANRLHVSENTVKGHVESLLTRLNARNRAEAVAAAARLNLL